MIDFYADIINNLMNLIESLFKTNYSWLIPNLLSDFCNKLFFIFVWNWKLCNIFCNSRNENCRFYNFLTNYLIIICLLFHRDFQKRKICGVLAQKLSKFLELQNCNFLCESFENFWSECRNLWYFYLGSSKNHQLDGFYWPF